MKRPAEDSVQASVGAMGGMGGAWEDSVQAITQLSLILHLSPSPSLRTSVQEPDKEAEEVAAALAAQEDVVINADLPAMIKEDPFHQLIGGEVSNGTACLSQGLA